MSANLGEQSGLAVKLTQAEAGWHVPLLRAAMAGNLQFMMLPPGARVPLRLLDPMKQRKPLVIVLNGDGHEKVGADGFPQAARLLRWSRFAMLHGTGGQAFHYQCAVEAARFTGRVLIAECIGADLDGWVALKLAVAPTTPALIVKVPPGQPPHPHETAPAGAVMQ